VCAQLGTFPGRCQQTRRSHSLVGDIHAGIPHLVQRDNRMPTDPNNLDHIQCGLPCCCGDINGNPVSDWALREACYQISCQLLMRSNHILVRQNSALYMLKQEHRTCCARELSSLSHCKRLERVAGANGIL
jgi:hypothetical protein